MPTGLDYLKQMIAGTVPSATMGDHVNIKTVEASEGRAVMHAVADGTHLNPMKSVHGGFVATVLDSACGCAVMSTLPEGKMFTSIDLAIKFMRPIPRGETLICEGMVQKPGRTVAFVEATLKTQDGKILAHGTSSCAVMDMPSA